MCAPEVIKGQNYVFKGKRFLPITSELHKIILTYCVPLVKPDRLMLFDLERYFSGQLGQGHKATLGQYQMMRREFVRRRTLVPFPGLYLLSINEIVCARKTTNLQTTAYKVL